MSENWFPRIRANKTTTTGGEQWISLSFFAFHSPEVNKSRIRVIRSVIERLNPGTRDQGIQWEHE